MEDEQRENLARVRSRIAGVVLSFAHARLAMGAPEFRMAELQQYVADAVLSAPASPDRVLRQLRMEGRVRYEVVSRSGSLYRLLAVGGDSGRGSTS